MSCNKLASTVHACYYYYDNASIVLVCAAEEVAAGQGPLRALPGYVRKCTAGGRAEIEAQLCTSQ